MTQVIDFDTGHTWNFWGKIKYSNGTIIAETGHLVQEDTQPDCGNPAKGQYVGPAIKGAGKTGGSADRLPMGMRLVWGFADKDIDNWMLTMDPGVRNGMRAIALALRDYGAIGTDNGRKMNPKRGAIWIEHDYTVKWNEIGFKKKKTFTVLYSLLSKYKNKARVLAPCTWPGGDQNRPCCSLDSVVNYPNGHQCDG